MHIQPHNPGSKTIHLFLLRCTILVFSQPHYHLSDSASFPKISKKAPPHTVNSFQTPIFLSWSIIFFSLVPLPSPAASSSCSSSKPHSWEGPPFRHLVLFNPPCLFAPSFPFFPLSQLFDHLSLLFPSSHPPSINLTLLLCFPGFFATAVLRSIESDFREKEYLQPGDSWITVSGSSSPCWW